MHNSPLNWYKIADATHSLDWQKNNMCIYEINGKKITLAHFKGSIFAFAHKCPHAGGIMASGFIDVLGNIVCPLHRYKFSIENGRNVSGEGYYLKTFPVETREDGIYVGISTNNFPSF